MALVVADRVDGHVCPLGELTYLHGGRSARPDSECVPLTMVQSQVVVALALMPVAFGASLELPYGLQPLHRAERPKH